MENTLQIKQSLLSAIGSINDRDIIVSIYDFVKNKFGKSLTNADSSNNKVEVSPEVWAIIKRIHPINVDDEKKVYYEHLNKKYE